MVATCNNERAEQVISAPCSTLNNNFYKGEAESDIHSTEPTTTRPQNFIDLLGQQVGRWTVIGFHGMIPGSKGGAIWLCRCECGNERPVPAKNLRGGRSNSCGCLHKELLSESSEEKAIRRKAKQEQQRLKVLAAVAARSVPVLTLKCTKCKQEKLFEDFRDRPDRSDRGSRRGKVSSCKDCEKAYTQLPKVRASSNARAMEFRMRLKKDNYAEYKRRERESNLRRKYGFGDKKFKAMLAAQGGLCAICGKPPTQGRGKKLHIDHDHKTKKIRGLLCHHCNISLGGFRDSVKIMKAAIAYIRKHKQSQPKIVHSQQPKDDVQPSLFEMET